MSKDINEIRKFLQKSKWYVNDNHVYQFFLVTMDENEDIIKDASQDNTNTVVVAGGVWREVIYLNDMVLDEKNHTIINDGARYQRLVVG